MYRPLQWPSVLHTHSLRHACPPPHLSPRTPPLPRTSPRTEWLTHASENIALPYTSFAGVNYYVMTFILCYNLRCTYQCLCSSFAHLPFCWRVTSGVFFSLPHNGIPSHRCRTYRVFPPCGSSGDTWGERSVWTICRISGICTALFLIRKRDVWLVNRTHSSFFNFVFQSGFQVYWPKQSFITWWQKTLKIPKNPFVHSTLHTLSVNEPNLCVFSHAPWEQTAW